MVKERQGKPWKQCCKQCREDERKRQAELQKGRGGMGCVTRKPKFKF